MRDCLKADDDSVAQESPVQAEGHSRKDSKDQALWVRAASAAVAADRSVCYNSDENLKIDCELF